MYLRAYNDSSDVRIVFHGICGVSMPSNSSFLFEIDLLFSNRIYYHLSSSIPSRRASNQPRMMNGIPVSNRNLCRTILDGFGEAVVLSSI